MDTSYNYVDKVQIWSWYDEFFYRVINPLEKFLVSYFKLFFGCMYRVEIA
jgi:hypothetical protein